jgi:hypothetical protein
MSKIGNIFNQRVAQGPPEIVGKGGTRSSDSRGIGSGMGSNGIDRQNPLTSVFENV